MQKQFPHKLRWGIHPSATENILDHENIVAIYKNIERCCFTFNCKALMYYMFFTMLEICNIFRNSILEWLLKKQINILILWSEIRLKVEGRRYYVTYDFIIQVSYSLLWYHFDMKYMIKIFSREIKDLQDLQLLTHCI